jgi:hypothetical protein
MRHREKPAICNTVAGGGTHLEKVPRDALDGIIDGENVDALAVLDVGAGAHDDHVTKAHSEVFAHHLVHADLVLLARVIVEHDANSVSALLPLQLHGVTTEELQLLHGVEVEGHDGVVIVDGIVDD